VERPVDTKRSEVIVDASEAYERARTAVLLPGRHYSRDTAHLTLQSASRSGPFERYTDPW